MKKSSAKILKRLLSLVLSICICLMTVPISAMAAEECICAAPCTAGEFNTECAVCSADAEACEVVASGRCGTNAVWKLTGPDDALTLTISGSGSISKDTQWDARMITAVVIEDGITVIGNYAFAKCTSLTSVTIPDSVTSIGNYAFAKCTSLTSVIYLGTMAPTMQSGVFSGSPVFVVYVPADYADDSFGGLSVVRLNDPFPPEADIYKIAVSTYENGKIKVSPETAAEGDTVTVEVQSEPGYKFGELSIVSEGGSVAFTETENNNSVDGGDGLEYGRYTVQFTMPAGNVTVSTSFSPREYTISYSTDAGAYESTEGWPTSYYYGTGVELPEDVAVENYEGYDFIAWRAADTSNDTFTSLTAKDYGDKILVPVLHKHEWGYAAKDDTITVSCTGDVFPDDFSVEDCPGGSVTISAPDELVYDGTSKDADLTYRDWELGDDAKPVIAYSETDRTNFTGKEIVASIELGEVSVDVTYFVEAKSAGITADDQEIIYGESLDADAVTADGLLAGHRVESVTLTPSTADATETGTVTPKDAVIVDAYGNDVTANYSITYVDGRLTITKGEVSIAFKNYAPGKDYDGQPLTVPSEDQMDLEGAAYSDVTFTWYKDSIDAANVLAEAPSDAGTYYLKASVQDTANMKGAFAASDAIVINPLDISDAVVTLGPALTYNGSEQTQTVESVAVDGQTLDAANYEVSGSTAADAGSYTLTITAKEGNNYTGSVEKEWTITRASIAPAVSIEGWVYGDQANDPAVSGNSGNGTVTYTYSGTAEGGEAYSGSEPPVNAGSYTVVVSVAETKNYEGGSSSAYAFVISKREVTVSGITAADKVYDGSTAAELNFSGADFANIKNGDSLTVTASGAFADANAGTGKTVTITGLTLGGGDAVNYQLSSSQQTDTKADITRKPLTDDMLSLSFDTTVYNSEVQSPTVTIEDSGLLTGSDYDLSGDLSASAVADYTITVTASETGNYSGTLSRGWTITKAAAEIVVGEDVSVVYGDTVELKAEIRVQGLTPSADGFTVSSDDTVTFKYGDEVLGTAVVVYASDAKDHGIASLTYDTTGRKLPIGENDITAVYSGSLNLNGVEGTAMTADLQKKEITVSITSPGGVYGGTITAASAVPEGYVDGDDPGIILTYTGTANDGTPAGTTEVPVRAGNYTVTASVTDEYYLLTGAVDAAFVIAKAEVQPPVIESKKYTGRQMTASVSDTVLYVVTANEGGIRVGKYEVIVQLRDPANYTWPESAEASITLWFNITVPDPTPTPGTSDSDGWDEIGSEIEGAGSGQEIIVDMNGVITIPEKVVEKFAGTDVDLSFDMGDYVWTIDASTITEADHLTLRTTVKEGAPEDVAVEGENVLTVNVNKAFETNGIRAALKLSTDSANTGKIADIYAVKENGEIKLRTSVLVGKNGVVCIPIEKASRYIIVIDDEGETPDGWSQNDLYRWHYGINGVAITGWIWDGKNWYYMDDNTDMYVGWLLGSDNKWYYLTSSGAMQRYWGLIDGEWYYFNSSGQMQTDWQYVGNKWYYLENSGAMQTGWLWDADYNAWYYLHDSDGYMLTDTVTPDGYYVSADGKWIK